MSGPWDEYAAPAAAGPWEEYGAAAPAAPAAKPKGFGADIKTALKAGVQEIPGMLTGLADIPAGLAGFDRPISRLADKAGEATGFTPGKWAKEQQQEYSEATQQGRAEIDQAWEDPNSNALDIAGAYARNPRTTALNVVQSLPSMVAGGVGARLLKAAGWGASAVARGAAGEGAVMAGQSMNEIDESVDPQRAALAAGAVGVGGAALGAAGGRVAQKLGLPDPETLLAGGKAAPGRFGALPLYKRAPAAMVQEGLIEELPQSLLETGAQNVAEGKPVGEGMARAGTEGALAGAVMGGVVGAAPRSLTTQKPEPTPAPTAPPGGPMERAAALAAGVGAKWQAIAPTDPQDDLAGQKKASEVGAQWQGMAPSEPADDLAAQKDVETRKSEEEGAAASRATDARINAVGQQWQDLGITDPADDLQRQRAGMGPLERAATPNRFQQMRAERAAKEAASAPAETTTAAAPAAAAAVLAGPSPAPEGQPGANGAAGADQPAVQPDRALTPVDTAAHEAATSPLNAKPQPTDGQKAAGNYQKGRARIGGLDVSIENPQGSTRSGVDPDGKPWSTTMAAHYGYVRGTTGKDGDQVDVFVKPGTAEDHAGPVFVVDQIDPRTGKLDEHKAVIGAADQAEAEAIYRSNYSADWKGLGAITELPLAAFRSWVRDGKKNQPLGALPSPTNVQNQPSPAVPAAPPEAARGQAPAAKGSDATGAADAKAGAGAAPALEAAGVKPLSVGPTPASTEPVTVKNGIVHIGRSEALNFESGEPVKVPEGASDAQVKQALKDAGALGKRQRFYGGQEASTTAAPVAQKEDAASVAPTNAPATTARPANWRGNFIAAAKVARGLGIDPKGKKLAGLVAEIEAKEKPAQVPTVRQQLFVQRGDKRFPVESLEDAATKWDQFRDATGAGVSDIGSSTRVVDQDGKEVARISYNGRVWPPGEWKAGMKPLVGEGFKSSLEPKTITQDAALPAPAESAKSGTAEESTAAAPGKPTAAAKPEAKGKAAPEQEKAPAAESAPETDEKPAASPPPQPAVQEGKDAPAKIEDFGEKLEGARKDYAATLKDAMSVDVAAEPLSKSWPEPNYGKLLEGGSDPFVVAFIHAARDEVPSKPQSSWKVKRWADQVKMLRGLANQLLSGDIPADKLRTKMAEPEFRTVAQNIGGRAELYERVGHEQSMKGIRVTSGSYGMYRGQTFSPPKTMWTVEKKAKATAFSNWPTELAMGDTREQAIQAFVDKVKATPATAEKKTATFDLWRENGRIHLGKKLGREYVTLYTFADVKEARAFRDANLDELTAALDKYKSTPFERRTENAPRVGEDHRGGARMTPEVFNDTFGFRGVQFGNYVENSKRQQDLNDAYDSLMDLAAVLGVPPKALSLDGQLGLAFGARGKGGKNAPAAHFEPDRIVINLTKEGGAGSLAHEWFHAVDAYFGRLNGGKGGNMTAGAANPGVRAEMQAAFTAIRRSVNDSGMRKRSLALDNRRSKPYWLLPHEMAARAFESYTVAKLQDQNATNDYLANIVSEDFWKAQDALMGHENEATYPYPTDSEMGPIREAFDNFFRTVQTKETDSGVAMFDIGRRLTQLSYQGYEKAEVPRVQAARKLSKLIEQHNEGKISDGAFNLQLRILADQMAEVSATKQANRVVGERERGADLVREKLIRARRQGEAEPGMVGFAMWLLDQSPQLANGLGLSMRKPGENTGAGQYNGFARVVTLFKDNANEGTAVHEILHHTERMMPDDVQRGIARSWSKAFAEATRLATPEQRAALAKVAEAIVGGREAQQAVHKAFRDGVLDYDKHYQLVNASEFWAVNATRILQGRHEADSWIGKAKQWLSELIEKAKGLFGLKSDAPILAGLRAVLDGDGTEVSKLMLSEGSILWDVTSFKRGDTDPTTLRVTEIKTVLADALAALTIPYAIHPTVEAARIATGYAGIPRGVKGAYFKGKLHLVADSIAGPLQAEEVFWHEVNHAGLDAMYGMGSKPYESAMRGIALQNQNIRQAAKAWFDKYGAEDMQARIDSGATPEYARKRTQLQAIDEALAELSGRQGAKINGLHQWIAAVQRFMRSIGLNRLANAIEGMTDSQALAMIMGARDAVTGRRQARGVGALAPAFSKDEVAEFARGDNPKMSNKAAGEAFRRMVAQAEDDLHAVLFNWDDSRLNEDKDGIVSYPGRDSEYSRGKDGGRVKVSKRAFLDWLASDGPFDTKVYGPEIERDAEWRGQIERLREIAGVKENESPAPTSPGAPLSEADKNLASMFAGKDGDFLSFSRGVTDSAAFRKWFGDSKVVDSEGKPLVVYHGTDANVSEFDTTEGSFFFGGPMAQDSAATYGANVMQVYLSIKKPYRGSMVDLYTADFDALAKTYDGAVFTDEISGQQQWVAFRPNQIKSAIGNNGNFSPESGDIAFSRGAVTGLALPQTWQAPDATKLDDFLYSIQDKHIDTKRAVQAIRASIGAIADAQDPYLQEELFHGRAAMATKEFLEKDLRPLLTEMQMRGVEMSDFEEYLHNRHAQRRNEQVAKVNPDMPDGGSGIETADARAYLAGLPADKRRAYEALAKRVEQITRGTRELLVSSGLEKQTTIDAWEGAYGDEYVPLMREEMDNGTTGIGQGYSVRGSASKRAMGSNKPVANILANIALQREKAITRAQKQRVAQALYGLVLKAPNDEFWYAVDPALHNNPSQILATQMQLISLGLDPQDAESIAQETVTRYIDKNGQVAYRINPAMRGMDNVLAVRIDGEDKFVFFNTKDDRALRMVTALKNLDADQLGTVMGTVAKMTRWFASVNTQYNPVFGVTNITRDVQTALLNLNSTPLKNHKADVLKHTLSALRGIYIDLRDHRAGKQPTSAWASLFEEFQREGGATGYRDMFANAEDRAEKIADELRAIQQGKAMGVGRAIMGWLSDYNESMENAVRLAAYKVGKEQGLSNQQAASLAKNLTVNFNRKGQMALQIGALYAFFNAAVQGLTRMGETMFEGGKLSSTGKKILTGGILLGSMQALLLAAAGFDDDEPPDFVRERALVLPIGDGKYVAIPMPLGFHVIPNLGRIPTEWALGGFKNTTKYLAQILDVAADAFNPLGSAGASVQTIAPTIIDPLVALSENRDWTGKPIAKADFNKLAPTAGHTRSKDTATPWAKAMSYGINIATGGTDYKPGIASPTPDQIDYLIGQITGGVGREVGKLSQVASGTLSGEEVPMHKIPLVGRFIGTTQGQSAEASRFYDNLRTLGEHKVEIEGLRKDGRGAEVSAYLAENPDARLVMMANRIQREVSKLQTAKRALIAKGVAQDQVRFLDARITVMMKRLNDQVRSLEPT